MDDGDMMAGLNDEGTTNNRRFGGIRQGWFNRTVFWKTVLKFKDRLWMVLFYDLWFDLGMRMMQWGVCRIAKGIFGVYHGYMHH
ncbi:MAG: hypothetical protein ACO36I_00435 [Candidatus Latescibacterota bacterium]